MQQSATLRLNGAFTSTSNKIKLPVGLGKVGEWSSCLFPPVVSLVFPLVVSLVVPLVVPPMVSLVVPPVVHRSTLDTRKTFRVSTNYSYSLQSTH